MRPIPDALLLCAAAIVTSGCPAIEEWRNHGDAVSSIPRIDPSTLEAHMRILADDSLEGRRAGTEGFAWAAEYVAGQLEAMGLEPAGEDGGFFQRVLLRRGVLEQHSSSLILTRDGESMQARMEADYYLYPRYLAEEITVSAPVVYTGFGISAPELGHDDLADLDLEGTIAAVFTGAPGSFSHHARAVHSSPERKLAGLVERGAVGVLILHDDEDLDRFPWDRRIAHARMPGMRWIDSEGKVRDAYPELRVLGALHPSMLETIVAGTPLSVEELLEAKRTGKTAPFDTGLKATARTFCRLSDVTSRNVAGRLNGRDPAMFSENLALTAHLDHVGTGEPINGDATYNGAYDNASGIAVLIETARALSSIEPGAGRSILFLAFTGGEMGLLGSGRFVDEPTVPPGSIVGSVNLDTVLMLHPLRDVIAHGAGHSSLASPLRAAAERLGIAISPDPHPEETFFVRSDQYSFVKRGIPSLLVVPGHATDDPAIEQGAMEASWMRSVYHTPGDDMSQDFDFEAGADFARLIATVARLVADDPDRPSWNQGDLFADRN